MGAKLRCRENDSLGRDGRWRFGSKSASAISNWLWDDNVKRGEMKLFKRCSIHRLIRRHVHVRPTKCQGNLDCRCDIKMNYVLGAEEPGTAALYAYHETTKARLSPVKVGCTQGELHSACHYR